MANFKVGDVITNDRFGVPERTVLGVGIEFYLLTDGQDEFLGIIEDIDNYFRVKKNNLYLYRMLFNNGMWMTSVGYYEDDEDFMRNNQQTIKTIKKFHKIEESGFCPD